jgi:(p)ppGpp synthase/HD superfamily hydrolase
MYSYNIEQAIRAATVLHNGQSRKGKSPYPYISHLIAVAFLLRDYTNDEDIIVAALLHDTLEDTDYTPEELEKDFGKKVRSIVEGVTDVQKHERSQYTWKQRQEHYFKALSLAPLESLYVSAADKIHNMRSIVEEYNDDTEAFGKQFGTSFDDLEAKYDKLKVLLHDRLKNDIMNEFDHVHGLFAAFLQKAKETHEIKHKK